MKVTAVERASHSSFKMNRGHASLLEFKTRKENGIKTPEESLEEKEKRELDILV